MNLSILVSDETLAEVLSTVNRKEDFDYPEDRITLEEVKGNKKLFKHLVTGATVVLDNNSKPSLRIDADANYANGNYDDLWASRIP